MGSFKSLARAGIAVALGLPLCAGPAMARQVTTPDPEKPCVLVLDDTSVKAWISTYYVTRPADQVGRSLAFLSISAEWRDNPKAAALLAAFLAEVFRDNPDRVGEWLKAADYSGSVRDAVAWALWNNHDARLQAFDADAARRFAAAPADTGRPVTVEDENRLWGAFFASGDERPLVEVIDMLDDSQPLSADAARDADARTAAAGMLTANMRVHERVARLIRAQDGLRTGPMKARLDAMITGYEAGRVRLPTRDGDFSAAVTVSDAPPASAPAPLPASPGPIATFRVRQKIMTHVDFSGMKQDDTLTADVTWGLRITGPRGKVVFEEDNLKGWNGPVAGTAARVFHGSTYNTLTLGVFNPRGVYKVDAVVHDNIAHVDIPVHTQVVLVP